ncbi:MAG: CTP synthase [Spirochaetes bacterium]|nr:CTP synthase [Spirochaetota bacterium]
MTKYVFVTGGVLSSLGKGIATASIGRILKNRGIKVTFLKIDPYINVDPGTLSPYQHGEVYVTEDGAETDLDLGHYERFVGIKLTRINNFTTGQIYYSVIQRERMGDYRGKTVQVVPHVIEEIILRIKGTNRNNRYQAVLVELGGTIGDIESQPFTEAIRQMKLKLKKNVLHIHLVLVPYIKTAGELKTKPAQHSVKTLNELGLQPDILLCRTEKPLPDSIREKLSLFCNVEKEAVIQAVDVDNIYKIPTNFKKVGLDKVLLDKIQIKASKNDQQWDKMVEKINKIHNRITIGLVGKYVELHDAYKSVIEALTHGGIENNVLVQIKWIQSEFIHDKTDLKDICGLLVPGGFGERGIEGKIQVIKVAREHGIPFLGLCLGMQCAIIEYARHVLHKHDAHSTEFKTDCHDPVIDIIETKKNIKQIGGTLRKGGYLCHLKRDSKAYRIYKQDEITERHRHRYEFNNQYRKIFSDSGMVFSGLYKEKDLVEIIELPRHPFFIGVQFHPEFQSRPDRAHPLFSAFIKASLDFKKSEEE